jgi:hypothetical protein
VHNEELQNLHASPNIIRVIKSRRTRWVEHIVRMGEMENSYKILVGKYEGKKQLGRPTFRCEDDIKVDRTKLGCEGMD